MTDNSSSAEEKAGIKAPLKFGFVNTRSIKSKGKLSELNKILAGNDYHTITVSETWLSNNNKSKHFRLDGFQLPFRRDREHHAKQRGGGVAVYVSNSVGAIRLPDLESPDFDNIVLKLTIHKKTILLVAGYIPPNQSKEVLEAIDDHFENVLMPIKDEYDMIVIGGDLNAKHEDWLQGGGSNPHGECFFDLFSRHGVTQLVEEPTHVGTHGESLVDIVATDSPGSFYSTNVTKEVFHTSDHKFVTAVAYMKVPMPKKWTRKIRNFYNLSIEELKNLNDELENAAWDELVFTPDNCKDVDKLTEAWINLYLEIVNKHIPEITKTIYPDKPPWWNEDVETMSDKKRLLSRKADRARLSGNQLRIIAAEEAETGIQSALENKKVKLEAQFKNRMTSKLAGRDLCSKQFWGATNGLLGKKKKSSIPAIRKGGGYVTNPIEKSNLFNNSFVSNAYINDQNHVFPNKPPFPDDPLTNVETSEWEVLNILNSLDPNKATGPDDIGNGLLRITAFGIHKSVCRLFNLSFSLGKFPSNWKLANVVPIYKKGDTHDTSNYRPVSLLCGLSKVAEQVVAKRLRAHLERYNILNPMQSGFRPGHSTQTQLAALLHDITAAIDSGKKVRACFLDISKAFDRVSHKGLLIILESIGVSSTILSWLKSYLTGRKQRVVIDGRYSTWQRVMAGVPQGSVLGPLLFIIFINDLITKIDCKIHVYADDVMLFEIGDETEDVNKSLEKNLAVAETWGRDWLVEFNQSKTVAITFGDESDSRPLSFRNALVSDSVEHKHLGVVLQSNLKWTKHIEMVAEKAEGSLRYLTIARQFASQAVLSNIYLTLIRPQMEYCCSVWSSISVSDSLRLQKIQNRAARLVTGAPRYASIDRMHADLGWDYVGARRKYFRLTFFHQVLTGKLPSYLTQKVPMRDHNHNTRGIQVNTFKFNYNSFKNSLLPLASREYNDLPNRVKANINDGQRDIEPSTFKEKLKNFLIEKGVFMERPPPFLRWGSRSGNALHCALRLGFTTLNLHKFMFLNIGDPNCSNCGVREDVKHFLLDCNAYTIQRTVMMTEIHRTLINSDQPHLVTWLERPAKCLSLLLKGDSSLQTSVNWAIFQLVHKFIQETQRFK